MNYNKIIGYVLLAAGILLIILTLYHSYNIFTGISQPPLLFKIEEPVSAVKSQLESGGISQELQEQIKGGVVKQVGQIIPIEAISKALNLFIWSTFAWLLVFAGAQVAGIGIKMVK